MDARSVRLEQREPRIAPTGGSRDMPRVQTRACELVCCTACPVDVAQVEDLYDDVCVGVGEQCPHARAHVVRPAADDETHRRAMCVRGIAVVGQLANRREYVVRRLFAEREGAAGNIGDNPTSIGDLVTQSVRGNEVAVSTGLQSPLGECNDLGRWPSHLVMPAN